MDNGTTKLTTEKVEELARAIRDEAEKWSNFAETLREWPDGLPVRGIKTLRLRIGQLAATGRQVGGRIEEAIRLKKLLSTVEADAASVTKSRTRKKKS